MKHPKRRPATLSLRLSARDLVLLRRAARRERTTPKRFSQGVLHYWLGFVGRMTGEK